jgi:hypothetical protein
VYRVITHKIVRVVRTGTVVSVFDVRTRIEALDGPVPPPGEESHGFLDLEVTIARDGRTATVAGLDPTDCHPPAPSHDAVPVTEEDKEFAAEAREWIAFDSKWEKTICKQLGKYAWKSGRFVRSR